MSVAKGQGLVRGGNSMVPIRATLGPGSTGSTEVLARYTSGDYANDCGHLLVDLGADGSHYVAGLDSPNGTPELNVMKVVAGVQTAVARVSFPASNGAAYWERVRVKAGVVSVKVWKDSAPEPATWDLTWTDTSPLPGGQAGIESWDDGRGWAIDNFSAGQLP
jgi:hypothetical protein